MIIAICGPAASGKGTLARMLAEKLNLPHYDFGLLFRAIAFLSSRQNLDHVQSLVENRRLKYQDSRIFLKWVELTGRLTSEEVGLVAAKVASENPGRIAELACTMVKHQNFICDGRTCGSEIYPDADLVFYITASQEERASRRIKEEEDRNHFKARESLDNQRTKIPTQAIVLDTTGKTKEECLEEMISHLRMHHRFVL